MFYFIHSYIPSLYYWKSYAFVFVLQLHLCTSVGGTVGTTYWHGSHEFCFCRHSARFLCLPSKAYWHKFKQVWDADVLMLELMQFQNLDPCLITLF